MENKEKILTFDCYGTLLNTRPLYDYVRKIAEKNSISPDKAENIFSAYEDRLMYGEEFIPYDKLFGQILTYCDMELNTNVFAPESNNIIEVHKSFLPFDDVMPSLKYFKEKGYKLCLMSNSTHEIMGWHMEKFEHIFDDFLVAEDTKCYKPSLNFFRIAEEKFGLKQKQHCHIAKGYWWDIVPSSKLGWNKIWVNRNNFLCGRENEKPYLTVKSLNELKNIF